MATRRRSSSPAADPATDAAAEQAARQLARKRELDALVARLVACIPFSVLADARAARIAAGGNLAGGRPSLLTPTTAGVVLRAVAQGNYPTTACRAAGISADALREWQDRAAQGEEPFSAFVGMLDVAAGYHEARTIARLDEQADASWRAGVALAERRYKAHWGAQPAPPPVAPPAPAMNIITLDELPALLRLLGAAQPAVQVLDGEIVPDTERSP